MSLKVASNHYLIDIIFIKYEERIKCTSYHYLNRVSNSMEWLGNNGSIGQ